MLIGVKVFSPDFSARVCTSFLTNLFFLSRAGGVVTTATTSSPFALINFSKIKAEYLPKEPKKTNIQILNLILLEISSN